MTFLKKWPIFSSSFVILLLLSGLAFGQAKVGTTSAPFLGISVAPRATSMGSAFAAVSNDASAIYYNPGGLSRIPNSEFVFSHTQWLLGTNFNWVGLVLKLTSDDAVGLSMTSLDYGEEEITTVEAPEGTGALWAASDLAVSASYSRSLTDRFSIAGTAKYIQQKIYNESASTFAFDIGLLFTTQFNDMKLGMSISNFGSDMRFEGKDLLQRIDLDENVIGNNDLIVANLKTDNWALPLFFRVGLAMDVVKSKMNRVTVAVDAFRPSDNTEIINFGTEYAFNNWVFLRAGYKSLFREDSEEGLTAGAGLNYTFGAAGTWSLDYCFMDFGLFESIHMFSLKIGF